MPKEKQEKGLGEEIQAKIKEGEKGKKKNPGKRNRVYRDNKIAKNLTLLEN